MKKNNMELIRFLEDNADKIKVVIFEWGGVALFAYWKDGSPSQRIEGCPAQLFDILLDRGWRNFYEKDDSPGAEPGAVIRYLKYGGRHENAS